MNPQNGPAGIARITAKGLAVSATPELVAAKREQFRERASLLLPGFLDPAMVARVRDRLEQLEFAATAGPGPLAARYNLGTCSDPVVASWLQLLVNRPAVHRFLEELTGVHPLNGFDGGLRRYERDAGQFFSWHNDLNDVTRQLAISVQIGDAKYEGGLLQIRMKLAPCLLAEYGCSAPGDAVVFRVHEDLEHQITPVTGDVARTTFVGWFVTRKVPPLDGRAMPQRIG